MVHRGAHGGLGFAACELVQQIEAGIVVRHGSAFQSVAESAGGSLRTPRPEHARCPRRPGRPAGSERSRPWTNRRTNETTQVPVGIDPGFSHNVGLVGRDRDTGDRLIAKMDAAMPEMARAAVCSPWRGALFRRHVLGQSEGDWPVAVTPAAAATALDAQSLVVRLSSATARKQAERHGNVGAEDYALVQRILDEGEVYRLRDGRTVAFLETGGQLWRAVVKVTRDRRETYLTSLHRAQPHNLDAERRRSRAIDR